MPSEVHRSGDGGGGGERANSLARWSTFCRRYAHTTCLAEEVGMEKCGGLSVLERSCLGDNAGYRVYANKCSMGCMLLNSVQVWGSALSRIRVENPNLIWPSTEQ